MPVFHRPVQAFHTTPVYHPAPRPYVHPTYTPRTITRYVPGPTVTRNVYNTTYVNRGWSPDQRRSYEEGVHQREFARLMREGRLSREQAQAQAAMIAQQQAALAAQQVASQAATASAQAQSAAGLPPAPSIPNPQVAVSPGSAETDLGPTQDQSSAASEGGDSVGAKPHHLLLIGGIVLGAGAIGYMVFKKKKRSSAD